VTGDPDAGHDSQFLPGQLEGGYNAQIRLAGGQAVRAFGRNAEIQVEKAALGAVQHTPNQRERIQVVDRANAWTGNSNLAQISV
jgi:hypothetical protein